MAQIINLRAAKKRGERAKKRSQGDENAAKFGRTKAQRMAEEIRINTARTHLDGHKRGAP